MNTALQQQAPAFYDEVQLRQQLCQGYDAEKSALIADALTLAIQAATHDTQARPRGIDVALNLHRFRADASSVITALLCDPYLRETLSEGSISRFGKDTADLVQKVNWLNTFTDCRDSALMEPEQAELLRRMLLAVVNDVRAVLVKLAYRLERLRILPQQDYATRRCVAQETMDIFVPLANRLGLAHLKWELEDYSFRYLHPLEYGDLARQLAETRASREAYVQAFLDELGELLKSEGVMARIYGRPKHIHSIWRKMQRKHIALDELYDLRAVRVTVDSISDCYAVLGMVHSRWQHIAKEFDDYIANPKPNGYQSLHTVVIGPEGKPVEFQIRSRAMHAFAEYGVAAHWRYKEGAGGRDEAFERNIALLRGMLESPGDDHTLLENFKLEAQGSDIFVLSPKGRIVRLVKGATPLDFAYAIHTEVGHRCKGAKVNNRMVPLTYSLKSGEQVEILTGKQAAPSRHWLEKTAGFLHSSDARSKVRQWFKQQDYEQNWRQGKVLFDKERQRLGLREVEQKPLLEKLRYKRWEDFLAAIGRSEITPFQLTALLAPAEDSATSRPLLSKKPVEARICIPGVPNPVTHLAGCCKPQPGDAIVAYLSITRGLTIHRCDCANIKQLGDEQRQRLIDAYWAGSSDSAEAEIHVTANDRRGLLGDVTQALSNERLNITRAFSHTDRDTRQVTMQIGVDLASDIILETALTRLRRLDGVLSARRAN